MRWLLCHKAGSPPSTEADRRRGVRAGIRSSRRSRCRSPTGSPAPPTATTRSPTATSSARSCAGSPARASAQFFADEIAEPLGLEFWIGLPEEQEHRVAPLIGSSSPDRRRCPKRHADVRAVLGPRLAHRPRPSTSTARSATSATGQHPRIARRRGPRRERHHQRALAGPHVRRRSSAASTAPAEPSAHRRADRRGRAASARPRATTRACSSRPRSASAS